MEVGWVPFCTTLVEGGEALHGGGSLEGLVGLSVLEISATDLNRGSLFISKTGSLQGVDVVFAPTDTSSSTNLTLFSLKGWFMSAIEIFVCVTKTIVLGLQRR